MERASSGTFMASGRARAVVLGVIASDFPERPAFAGRADAARYDGDFAETAALLRTIRQPGDVIVVMGSGPVNRVIALARRETEAER